MIYNIPSINEINGIVKKELEKRAKQQQALISKLEKKLYKLEEDIKLIKMVI